MNSETRLSLLITVLIATYLVGCAPTGAMRVAPSSGLVQQGAKSDELVAGSSLETKDAQRRDLLWQQRTAAGPDSDYPIGPSDVLMISVPSLGEIQQRKVRVSAAGTIELPLVGVVRVGGIGEDGVAQKIDERLEGVMYNPQASVFVEEYRNREVAVVGEVSRPGMVLLTSRSETVLDVLTESGGVTSSAADEVILIPQGGNGGETGSRTSSDSSRESVIDDASLGSSDNLVSGGDSATHSHNSGLSQTQYASNSGAQALSVSTMSEPVRIPLRSNSLTATGNYLNLPVRPGDVLVVPGGGQVMVVGWVQTPGHFSVGSGLTVLGAIGAAGGPMFAADTAQVALLRSGPNGSKETLVLDLAKISRGDASDVAVKANDVIDVPYSGWRIGPYVFYSVLTRMGIGGPTIPY
jgi:protein involved in polysaccharide export with SLBB domain